MLKSLRSRRLAPVHHPVNFVDAGTFDHGRHSFAVLEYSGLERMTRLRVQARVRGTRHRMQFDATYDHEAHRLVASMSESDLEAMLHGPEECFDEYETLVTWQNLCQANLATARGLTLTLAA